MLARRLGGSVARVDQISGTSTLAASAIPCMQIPTL